MLDLPPDIPVISACADALHAGWQEVEACILKQDCTFAIHNENLEKTEIDYWTARNLHNGEPLEQAVPKGDVRVDLGDGFQMTTLGSAFLLVDFDNQLTEADEIHHVYRCSGGTTVLLDDKASSTIMVFEDHAWEGFTAAFAFVEENNGEFSESEWARSAEPPYVIKDLSITQELYFRLFPAAFPDESDWEIFEINPVAFKETVGHPPKVSFRASYSVIREY